MSNSQTRNVRQLKEFDTSPASLGNNHLPSFDVLVELAKHRPRELEAIRQHLCRQVIESAPEHMRGRLHGLQFKIDMERELARNPLSACLRISDLMNESLQELKALLGNPEEYLRKRTLQSAKILPFHQAD